MKAVKFVLVALLATATVGITTVQSAEAGSLKRAIRRAFDPTYGFSRDRWRDYNRFYSGWGYGNRWDNPYYYGYRSPYRWWY